MKRTISVLLAAVLLVCSMVFSVSATPSRGDLVRFVPTEMTVTDAKVKVEGYFVNLNTDVVVFNFREVEMTVYIEDEELVSGDFGTINQFEVEPLEAYYQSFTFNNKDGLKAGSYDCDETVYAMFSARFSTKEA